MNNSQEIIHALTEALTKARVHVDASAKAASMTDGFSPRKMRPADYLLKEIDAALARVPPEGEGDFSCALAQDVIDLVIAARIVAFEDQSPAALRELDAATEAFSERVPWDNDPGITVEDEME